MVIKEAVMRTIEQWLNETETSYIVSDKVSAADLALYHQLMQAKAIGEIEIDGEEYPRLHEWYGWILQSWNHGLIKGRGKFDQLCEKLSGRKDAPQAAENGIELTSNTANSEM